MASLTDGNDAGDQPSMTDVEQLEAELYFASLGNDDEVDAVDWGEEAVAIDEAEEKSTSVAEATVTSGDKKATVTSGDKKPTAKKAKPKTMREAGLDTEADIEDVEEQLVAAGASEFITDTRWDWKPIKELPDFIYDNVRRKFGFIKLSKVQEQTIPEILAGKDVIAQGKNGSGKTIAFFAGALSHIDTTIKAPQVIVIANTRELAMQEYLVCRRMVADTGITIRKVVKVEKNTGDPQEHVDRQKFEQHVLICTAGKLKEKLTSRKKDKLSLAHVRSLVLDEADDLIKSIHVKEAITAIQKENKKRMGVGKKPAAGVAGSKPIQLVSFSATYSQAADDNRLKEIENRCREGYYSFGKENPDVILKYVVQHRATYADKQHCARILRLFLEAEVRSRERTLIFVNSIDDGYFFASQLSQVENIKVGGVWAGKPNRTPHAMDANQRDAQMSAFAAGLLNVLVATDTLSRGIDLLNVNHVFMIGMPNGERKEVKGGGYAFVFDAENYLQRVGRTGRMGKVGTSVVLIPRDSTVDMDKIRDVQSKYACDITELPPFPEDENDDLPENWNKALDRS
jgi:ATP-dependent RNA helicase DeaD